MTLLRTGWAIFRGSFALQMATVAILAYGGWKANNAYQRHIGGQAVIAASKEAGKVANEKATEAHDNAARPGAAERLLRNACRDCK